MRSHPRVLIPAVVLITVLIPLGVSVMVEAAPWQDGGRPRPVGTIDNEWPPDGPTQHPGYDVTMTPNPECLGSSPSNCVDLTNTEFCPKFHACEDSIELRGWEQKTPDERAQFRVWYLAWMRSIPECPVGYDSNKPEFAGVNCTVRANPEAGPPAPPLGSEPLPFLWPTPDQGRLADPNCPPIYGWPVPEGAYCPYGGSERAEEEWKQAGSPMKGVD